MNDRHRSTSQRPDSSSAPSSANLLWSVGAAAIIAAAHLLSPSPSGLGTHRQLLPIDCIFHHLTGLPCPGCGLTTSFALAARGKWAAAFAAHYLGPAGYLLCWGVLFWGVLGALRCVKGPAEVLNRPGVILGAAAVLLGAWLVRLGVILWTFRG